MCCRVLPGCRVAAGVLPGCCRVLPGCRVPVRTSSQLVWALRLPGCRVAGYCRVLPGTAGLPGRCRVVAGLGCRVAGARAQASRGRGRIRIDALEEVVAAPADEEQAGAPADEGVPRVIEFRAPGAPDLDSDVYVDSGRAGSGPSFSFGQPAAFRGVILIHARGRS